MTRIENRFTLPLERKDLTVERGWDPELARQLVVRSKEDEIRKYARRDARDRFPNERAASEWYKSKGHVVYALGQKAALEGVAWFSQESKPGIDAQYTFAIRMYEAQRGHGLAGAFLEATHKDFETHKRYEGKLWLAVDEANQRARRFYEKHGYVVVRTEGDRLLMVRE